MKCKHKKLNVSIFFNETVEAKCLDCNKKLFFDKNEFGQKYFFVLLPDNKGRYEGVYILTNQVEFVFR